MSFEVSKNVLHIKLKGCGDIGLRGNSYIQKSQYRIIKYNDEYLMVNIINNWLVLFIPLLVWLTPKRYIKISQEELESLNTFKPAKNNAFWPALGVVQFY